MKSLAERWKEHYSSMEAGYYSSTQDDEEPEEQELIEVQIEKPVKSRENKDAKIKRLLHDFIQHCRDGAETKRRAKAITKIDSAPYLIKQNSLEHYIRQTLLPTNTAKHITEIIDQIETLGWKTTSKYHKYAAVNKALRQNSYMFLNVGSGMFKLRNSFSGIKIAPPEQQLRQQKPQEQSKITTIEDVVVSMAGKYQDENGIYPSRVHYVMKRMGYRCAYSSVYRAMQSEKFVRNGYWYRLNVE